MLHPLWQGEGKNWRIPGQAWQRQRATDQISSAVDSRPLNVFFNDGHHSGFFTSSGPNQIISPRRKSRGTQPTLSVHNDRSLPLRLGKLRSQIRSQSLDLSWASASRKVRPARSVEGGEEILRRKGVGVYPPPAHASLCAWSSGYRLFA